MISVKLVKDIFEEVEKVRTGKGKNPFQLKNQKEVNTNMKGKLKTCKGMSKMWMKQERMEHGVKPCTKAWLNMEMKEGHKSMKGKKINWSQWKMEDEMEPTHKMMK